MGELSDSILGYLRGRSPDEIRRLLARLEREAQLEAAERAEDATARRQAMASRSANDLAGELARLRSQQQFVDRAAYDETYRAYMKALEREQAASQPQAPAYSGRQRSAIQLELDQTAAQLSELRQQPSWKVHKGEYSRLVDKHNVLISELQAAPSTPPPQPKRQLSPLEAYISGEDGGENE